MTWPRLFVYVGGLALGALTLYVVVQTMKGL